MKIDILTIFPDFFRGPLDYGIVRRVREAGLATIEVHDLRAFAHDRHRTVDDRPFGGGEGMVLKPEPIFECIEGLSIQGRAERLAPDAKQSVVLLSAQGRRFDQSGAEELANLERIVLICGELGAAVILDTVTRLIPGALGNEASARQESFTVTTAVRAGGADSTCASGGLLDYPHYTRPADFRGLQVPEVLVSGNHEEIRRWRRRTALEKTLRNRPDLLEGAALGEEDKKLLVRITGEQAATNSKISVTGGQDRD